jgi:malate dehydrogenase
MTALNGVVMELQDLAYPCSANIVATDDPEVAFKDADVVVFLGSFPRMAGMERADVMGKNVGIFSSSGSALGVAKSTVKCLVVGNPANTNAAVLAQSAPIDPANITALTRLDHNRATSLLARKAGVAVDAVSGVVVWGNHSSTQYPDVRHAKVNGKSAREAVNDDSFLEGDFITTVQKRGGAIIEARKLSSAMSAAKAICDHLRDWIKGTTEIVSMGVMSDGSHYDIPAGVIYSFPCTCENGAWTVQDGLPIDDFSRERMDATAKELVEELELAKSMLAETKN